VDAETVATQERGANAAVPVRKAEHAVELLHALFAPLVVGMDHDLGIASRVEAVTALAQPVTQLGKVVDLAVEHDPGRLVLVVNRLVAAGHVDDAEPAHAQSDAIS